MRKTVRASLVTFFVAGSYMVTTVERLGYAIRSPSPSLPPGLG